MLIHGGFNCEGKITLDDFCLFDIEAEAWVSTRVVNKQDGKVIESGALYGHHIGCSSDSSDVDYIRTKEMIGPRKGHCLVAIFKDSDVYSPAINRKWI